MAQPERFVGAATRENASLAMQCHGACSRLDGLGPLLEPLGSAPAGADDAYSTGVAITAIPVNVSAPWGLTVAGAGGLFRYGTHT